MLRLKRLAKSFKYAFKGAVKTFKEEQNLRIQSKVGILVLIFASVLGLNKLEIVILIFSISLVLVMELVNSAIERVGDVLKPRLNGYIKEIKDIMAAAVMIASFSSVVIGVIIFWPYLLEALN